MLDSFARRFNTATSQALDPIPAHTTNGDETLADKGATYTKGLRQASAGKVDLAAYTTFTNALASGVFADFEAIALGGSRKLNGPTASYALTSCGADSSQFGDPVVHAHI